jgi:hypothetical protein
MFERQYLDRTVDLEKIQIPLARFPGSRQPLLDRELICSGLKAFIEETAPDPAPVIERKENVPYYIAGTLREAEFVGKTREQAFERGQSTIGKQRSSTHVETLGPAVFLDHDGDVLGSVAAIRDLGAGALIFSSHSYGFTKPNATQPSRGGRVAVFLNRQVTPAEYRYGFDALNHLLGGEFDEAGRSPAQCYGRHARRSPEAPHHRVILDGVAFDADALIELGKSLHPEHRGEREQPLRRGRTRGSIAEGERARLLGKVRAPDDYNEWMSGAGAFKRAHPADPDLAFQCFDNWSACSAKYQGREATQCKFDQVPAEYDGPAIPVDLGMLHWRARRRAENLISTLYSPARHCTKDGLNGAKPESLAVGIDAEPIPLHSPTAEEGIVALDYVRFCWGDKVLEQAVSGLTVPPEALAEASRRSEDRNKRIELAGRTPHVWGGKNLAEDTSALADTIIASGAKIYRHDKSLVRIAAPTSDPATAERMRKLHHYKGRPGDPGDPALHAGERLSPILHTDTEVLREMIATSVAEEYSVNQGTAKEPDWRTQYKSFAFKPSANIQREPDKAVLNDLLKRELPTRVPEILGVVTAPVMPNLPKSTNAVGLLDQRADHILTQPGFDAETGLFLSPLGSIVEAPATPSEDEVKAAAKLLQLPWTDFSFVSPADGISADAGLSVLIYAMMIAANRRALDKAPGIAISSHGEGYSNGKTLSGQVLSILATGDVPAPVSLSPDFNEQRKQLVTQLLQGDGSMFLDNVPNGTRFDSAPLAAAMTSSRFKDRLLGSNKEVNVSTRALIVATGNALNLAGDLASRFMLAKLNTGLERPEDRGTSGFKIPELGLWAVERRQELVAAVHTIVRGYLQHCRRCGGTPADVAARQQVTGSRFGGPSEVLRDAFLWAFPDLPDPFLGFQASAVNSSTKRDAALVLRVLDGVMVELAGKHSAPAWATTTTWLSTTKPPQQTRWETNFRARWARLLPQEQQRRYRTTDLEAALARQWGRLREVVIVRSGRPEVRAGRARFKSSEIIEGLPKHFSYQPVSEKRAVLEGVMGGRSLSSVSLGRWLKNHLVDAPVTGLVLRSAEDRLGFQRFWIERTQ